MIKMLEKQPVEGKMIDRGETCSAAPTVEQFLVSTGKAVFTDADAAPAAESDEEPHH